MRTVYLALALRVSNITRQISEKWIAYGYAGCISISCLEDQKWAFYVKIYISRA